MSELDDRVLAAVLASRADRLGPDAEREVLAGVRDQVRVPRRGAALAAIPLLTGRTPALGAGWAAAAMIAAIVLAIAATRLPASGPPASAAPPAAVVASGAPSPAVATPGAVVPATPAFTAAPVPGASGEPSPGRIQPRYVTLEMARAAVKSGSLDGRIVLVESTLRTATGYGDCSVPPCGQATLDFVGGVVTGQKPGLPVEPASLDPASGPLAGAFVVVPWRGSVLLVGRLQGSLASPILPGQQNASYQPPDEGGAIALQAVAGTLDWDVVTPCPPNGDCSPPGLTATFGTPGPDGAAGVVQFVTVADPAVGVDRTVRRLEGPFLVRTGTGNRHEVVARYALGDVVVVDMPRVGCDLAAGTVIGPCADVVALAMGAVPADMTVEAVDVGQGSYCPPGWSCPTVAPDRAHAIVYGGWSGTWVVEMAWDASGHGTVVSSAPLPSGDAGAPTPSTAP